MVETIALILGFCVAFGSVGGTGYLIWNEQCKMNERYLKYIKQNEKKQRERNEVMKDKLAEAHLLSCSHLCATWTKMAKEQREFLGITEDDMKCCKKLTLLGREMIEKSIKERKNNVVKEK